MAGGCFINTQLNYSMDAAQAYYSDAGAPDSLPPEPQTPKEEPSDTKTALIPIDFFQGKELKPGDTCEVKIEQVMDDQVSVTYVGSESGEEESAEMPEAMESEAPPAPAELFG